MTSLIWLAGKHLFYIFFFFLLLIFFLFFYLFIYFFELASNYNMHHPFILYLPLMSVPIRQRGTEDWVRHQRVTSAPSPQHHPSPHGRQELQKTVPHASPTLSQNYLRCQGSTLPLYSYDFPERFVRQRDLHDPYLCNRLTDFLRSKFCELSRPVIVHCHGHLPICPIWACPWPWTKNLSNLAQIGSRLCGKQISGTAGWI